jgi:hypothetical protein
MQHHDQRDAYEVLTGLALARRVGGRSESRGRRVRQTRMP